MNYRDELGKLDDGIAYVSACLEQIHTEAGDDGLGERQADWDAGFAYITQANERRGQLEQLAKIERSVNAGATVRGDSIDVDFAANPEAVRNESALNNPWDLDEVRAESRLRAESAVPALRGRALTAIERMQGMTDKRREVLTGWVESLDDESETGVRFLSHILATSSPDYMRSWVRQFKTAARGGMDANALDVLTRAMSLTDNAGGYAVPQQLDPNLILTSDGSTNPVRQIARKVMATGDVWTGLSTTHASWSFDAEAAEVSDDATTFAQPSVTVRTARGFIPFSMEVQMDYPGFTQDLATILANGKDDLEATVFITGASGSNQPIGIVTALTGGSSVIASDTTDTLAWADTADLILALPAKYRSRAAWIMNPSIIHAVREDAIGAGYDASYQGAYTDPTGALPGRLLGAPLYEASAMDGAINAMADNYVEVVGDFQYYVIADRAGFALELVPHLFATGANRPSGQRGFFAHYRVGADSVNDSAFRMLNVT